MKQIRSNRITILVLTILVILDITINYFLNKEKNSFKFEKFEVLGEKIDIKENKRVYKIKLIDKTLTCNDNNLEYDKIFDIKIKNKTINGDEVVDLNNKKIYYYGYLDSKIEKNNTNYYDFFIEVDFDSLNVDLECKNNA